MTGIKRTLLGAVMVWAFSLTAMAEQAIEIGTSAAIDSKVLSESRPYLLYLPPAYAASQSSFPVIYLLDGDQHRFTGFIGMLEALSTPTLGGQVQQAIVVGIPNTHRARDLTPTRQPEWVFRDRVLERFDQTGEAAAFSRFIAQELMPHIQSSYRTSGKNLLVGESFGGLFAAYVLLHSQAMFSDYLLIDPTAVWHKDYLNRTLASQSETLSSDANVFFAFANNAHLGDIGTTNYQWGSRFASALIDKLSTTGKRANQQYFAEETHGTVALMGWYHGLKFLLPRSDN